jgi:hypothetical protein
MSQQARSNAAGKRRITLSEPSSASSRNIVTHSFPGRAAYGTPDVSSRAAERAVYAYIRAVRTLGRTRIDTDEIAAALRLPVEQVNETLHALRKKGVRLYERQY